VTEMRKTYRKLMGARPAEAKRPSDEQLAALKSRLDAGHSPYADFGVFGPFGRIAAKLRKYEIKTMVGDKLITKLVSGPATYEQWLGSWGVYKAAMIMLQAASPGTLDDYQEGIRLLTVFYPRSWGDIALADVDMRYEYWGRVLDETEGDPSGFNPRRPWDYVIGQCAYGESKLRGAHWWEMNLVKPLQSPEDTQVVISRMEGRPLAHRYPANSSEGALAPPPQAQALRQARQGSAAASSSSSPPAFCAAYNEGRCAAVCPYGQLHACCHCGKTSHPVKGCYQLFPKPLVKGAGKGKAPPPNAPGAGKRRRGVSEISSTTLDYER
jgi:hypothetical protein